MWKFDEYNDSKARNRLSLMSRVEAIRAYEKTPNYSQVGLMFKCSSKQIRTIIKNKKQIMALYESLPKLPSVKYNEEDIPSNKRRLRKVSLLGIVMYEWFLRARRNPGICIISYKLIQDTAIEVKKILNVENFFPNNAWLLHFRQKFHITDSDMKIQSNDPGPTELNIEKIVADVVVREKNKNIDCQQSSFSGFDCYDDSSASSAPAQPLSLNATEPIIGTSSIITTSENNDEEPPSKYPKLEPIDVIEIESDDEYDDSNGHTVTNSAIKTIDQALEHLKPLEDFALMREDYRVIGLISQLEVILKNFKKPTG